MKPSNKVNVLAYKNIPPTYPTTFTLALVACLKAFSAPVWLSVIALVFLVGLWCLLLFVIYAKIEKHDIFEDFYS